MFSPSSKDRLTTHDLGRFAGETLFDRIGRTVCRAGCLPRKELYEAWEVARRVRRVMRGGRIVDLGGGHGLLAQVLLLLDDTSPSALVADRVLPPSSIPLHDAMAAEWPRLAGRIIFEQIDLDDVAITGGDLIVSSHACGALTDRVLERAIAARARVAVLPCCHDAAVSDGGDLDGWLDAALAIDVMRAAKLRQASYRVKTQLIPATVTPKNRLLLGTPG